MTVKLETQLRVMDTVLTENKIRATWEMCGGRANPVWFFFDAYIRKPAISKSKFQRFEYAFRRGGFEAMADCWDWEIAYRLESIKKVDALLSTGLSVNHACYLADVCRGSYDRWKNALQRGGRDALQSDYSRCGRKKKRSDHAAD